MIRLRDNSKKRWRPGAEGGGVVGAGVTPRLVLAAVFGALAAACSVGLLATAAWLISQSARRPTILSLMAPAVVVLALGLGRILLRFAEWLAGDNAALGLLGARRVRVYDALARLAPAGLAEYRTGELIARLVADIDSFADRWLRVRLPYVAATVAGAGAVALVTVLQPAAGLVLAATLVVSALAGPAVAITLSRREERSLTPLRSELAASTLELLAGADELIAFGAAGRALAGVESNGRRLCAATVRSGYGRGAGAAVSALATGAALLGAVFFAVPAVRSGALAGVLLAVVVLTPLAAHEVFAALGPAAQEIPALRAANDRVAQLLAQRAPVSDPVAPVPLPEPPYRLAVRGLTAGWTPGLPVLGDVSFDIPAGSRVAIIGPTGSGKTTLAMVLLRFLDYGTGEWGKAREAGTVTLNGTDLRAFAGDELREIIGLCEQDPHVFDSTLEANLRVAKPEASEEDLRAALDRARLLTWADSLPVGLDTPIGEHGDRLSGEQRQRLALARVLLADFPVVILDGPAEHLDEEAAGELAHDLLSAVAGRTVLLMTDRLVDPGVVAQVLRLCDGRVSTDARADVTARPGRLAP
jgi:ATP-binding cassette subfamily C protein CydC